MNALRGIVVLAVGTLLEALRSRLLWVSLVFAVVLVALSTFAASVALFERSRLIIDLGLSACAGLGSVIALATSITFFAAQLQSRTAYPVLARPIPRAAYVLGRFFGLWVAMMLVVACMGAATAGTCLLFDGTLPQAFLPAVGLSCLQMAVVVALGLLFSTLAVPALAASYAAGLTLAGTLSDDIMRLAMRKGDTQLAEALRLAYYALPDFSRLSVRSQAANNLPVPPEFILTATAYAITYTAALLALAVLVFTRRKAV